MNSSDALRVNEAVQGKNVAIDVAVPECSYLYSLEPIGVGTSMVEGLQSYIARLAYEHCVSIRTLLQQAILPRLYPNIRNQVSNVSSRAVSLSGMSSLCASMVETLEALTLRRDLRFLTMLPWQAGIAPLGMMRQKKAWCPTCYREWIMRRQKLYEPLIWSIAQVACCPVHRNYLECRCHTCGKEQPILPPICRAGYCTFCKSALSNEMDVGSTSKEPGFKVGPAQDTWAEEQVGTLLASSSSIHPDHVYAPMRDLYLRVIASQKYGKRRKTANNLGVRKVLFERIARKDNYKPSLALVLRLCRHANLSVLNFLTGVSDYQSLDVDKLPERPILKSSTAATLSIKEQQEYLQNALASEDYAYTGIAEHARRMDTSRELLHRRFPELCKAITKRAREHRSLQRAHLLNSLAERARAATLELIVAGEYPSARRVETYLDKAGCMRIPVVQAAWRETLGRQDLN
jgi:hypothetical protein